MQKKFFHMAKLNIQNHYFTHANFAARNAYIRMYVCMYVCIYVCVCVYLFNLFYYLLDER